MSVLFEEGPSQLNIWQETYMFPFVKKRIMMIGLFITIICIFFANNAQFTFDDVCVSVSSNYIMMRKKCPFVSFLRCKDAIASSTLSKRGRLCSYHFVIIVIYYRFIDLVTVRRRCYCCVVPLCQQFSNMF